MKDIVLIDTNIIVRLVTADDPDKAKRSAKFFKKIESGEIDALIVAPVLCEAVWVLTGKVYKRNRLEIADYLSYLLSLKGVKNEDKSIIQRSLIIFKSSGSN